MILAKLSTALTIPFGPVLDAAGAEYTSAAVGDVKISKNNGTPAALNGSATLTHKEVGIYELVLTTDDISAVGVLTITLSKTTYIAPPVHINVLPAKVYASLVAGSDNLEADAIQLNGSALAAQVLAAKNYGYRSDAVVLTADGASDTARGTNLRTAYTAAKALTPGGNALSAINRAAVLIPPGRYDFATGDGSNNGLVVDGEFVDLIGLGDAPSDVFLTSQIATASRGTLQQTADNVHIKNLTIDINAASAGSNDSTRNSAYFPATELYYTELEDVVCKTSGAGAWSTRIAITYGGKYTRCTAQDEGWGAFGVAAGTFIECTGGAYAFGGDVNGTASGMFIDCIGGAIAFGAHIGATASGTFIRCRGETSSFGGGGGSTASGTFIDCIAGDGAFGGSAGSTASGVFIRCTGTSQAFGGGSGSTSSGVFLHCVGGASSFQSPGTGLYVNCSVAGAVKDNAHTLAATWTDTKAGYLDATITSRHEAGAAVAKSPATLDWSADVSNKPTIGTSTLTTGDIPTAAAIADAVLDEAAAGHSGVIPTNLDAAISTRGTSTLDAAGVRTALGMAVADLDDQLAAIPTSSTTVQITTGQTNIVTEE